MYRSSKAFHSSNDVAVLLLPRNWPEVTQRQNECACSGDLWFERESITNAPFQSPNSHLLPQYFFVLNKICDGGSSKEPFLKAATLSILIWAYPRETKTNNGNFKNATILPPKIAHAWQACALILPLCHRKVFSRAHAQSCETSANQVTQNGSKLSSLPGSWEKYQFTQLRQSSRVLTFLKSDI